MSGSAVLQPSFDDLGTALRDVTFCVVDLETTGSGLGATITEFGAVKVRGGVVEGEFQTLVNPGGTIDPTVVLLTGITDAMVATAPALSAVLPSWLEFSRGAVLVAHNARFDVGFLRRACERFDHPWPDPVVLDTLALSRSILARGEVPNHRLSTLARHFRATTSPTHRALDDARATVDVLHGLIERVGNLGVDTLEDLTQMTRRVPQRRRQRRVWARDLPTGPGVYWFHLDRADGSREILYVGTSRHLRHRVQQYFTASERRARMDEMVRVATGVQALECATDLEASVRELRLIAAHGPRYNRRSRRQESVAWVTLTPGPFPRLSLVRRPTRPDRPYWGPFTHRQEAVEACRALREVAPLRECTDSPARHPHGCAVGEMGRCAAPCLDPTGYDDVVTTARTVMTADVRPAVDAIAGRVAELADQERYEEAGALTDRGAALLRATRRRARLASLADCPQIVAARRVGDRWHIHVVRHGRLAGAAACPVDVSPLPTVEAVVDSAETVTPRAPGTPACTVEEAEVVADWFEQPGVRLVEVQGCWAWPLHSWATREDLASRVQDRRVQDRRD